MDSSSKKTADNDRQGLEMDRDERIIELEKEISDLQKENQELMVLPNLHCRKFPKLPLCPAML
jgi:hypothetical protein